METWGKRRFPSWARSIFSGQHSIHINTEGNLMIFDNGVKTKKSRALSFTINEQQKVARVVINAPLPDELYSEKMGSAYLLNKNTILQCSTNKEMLVATDLTGKIVGQVKMGGLTYRAQFISGKAKQLVGSNSSFVDVSHAELNPVAQS